MQKFLGIYTVPLSTGGDYWTIKVGHSEANGFLIDGFPRELTQAHMFEKQVKFTLFTTTVTG